MPDDQLSELMDREPGLRRDWDEQYGDRMQKLVFIGEKMDKRSIIARRDKGLAD